MTRPRVQWPCALIAALAVLTPLAAEVRKSTGAPALKQQLERLRVVGSVMMIAAHPDDENTALLAYCSQGRKLRTAYLSLTRGEGGQNLIGSEQGPLLGVIRTQELLAARRIDGSEQFFSRAIDFGFSKTAEETLQKWGRREVLSDVVWAIRRYRPDVIFLRFSGTPRDGHGHHQASSMLGKEAFTLAADPKAFPEQLKFVQPWQAKRILWNGFSFNRQQEKELDGMANRLMVDTGEFDAVLGLSYGELAGLSRSQHRSQGMGSAERRGSVPNYLFHYGGEQAKKDFMEGIDTSWNRLPGGAPVQKLLDEAAARLQIDAPESIIPALLKARPLIAAINHPDARRKLVDLDEAIAMAAGLWLEVNAAKPEATPGSQIELTLTAINRGHAQVELAGTQLEGIAGAPLLDAVALPFNQPQTAKAKCPIPAAQPLTQPLQLREPRRGDLYGITDPANIGPPEAEPVLRARFQLKVQGEPVEIVRPVENRYVDRVRGELTRPFIIVPAVSIKLSENALLFASPKPRVISAEVTAHTANASGTLSLQIPQGWRITPAERTFQIAEPGQVAALEFTITPPAASARGEITATARVGQSVISSGLQQIAYEHIPPQTILPAIHTRMVREDVKVNAHRIGYVMGAGDEVPDALREMGCEVTFLEPAELARGDLSRYEAIVTGVRAWNVREDLRANHARLVAYMEQGGTVLVQYNVTEGGPFGGNPELLKNMGPFPMKPGRDRTTVEEAAVKLVRPDHRLMQMPNRITPADFDGWVQERALYFPAEWDPRYEPILETCDPGEAPQKSGLLYAHVGKGAYVFTSYAWFRQLPAGVPGAYRIFANLISAGR
ncbi:MAG: PIG-L family deacetylase [Bryobacterales bacterium]|nr:PIG-L family deacetylase [Bryobacterales bacterium]